MKWEAEIEKWESEPYLVEAATLSEIIGQIPDEREVSSLRIYQIGNPLL